MHRIMSLKQGVVSKGSLNGVYIKKKILTLIVCLLNFKTHLNTGEFYLSVAIH